jgi:Divergent InlB B-repeat domain
VAAPALHQELAGWSGCTEEPAPHECVVAMNGQDRSVKAEFTPIRRHLSITIVGSGTVSADHGGIAGCNGSGGSCSAYYLDGEIVRLTALAVPGYIFAGWSGGLCGGTGTCELGLESDASVTANFAAPPAELLPAPPKPHIHLRKASIRGATATLTVNVSGPGAIAAAGKWLSPEHVHANKAGVLVVRVHLTKGGQMTLERSRRRKLKVPLTITFSPADGGGRVVINHVLTFRAHLRHHGGGGPHGKRHR